MNPKIHGIKTLKPKTIYRESYYKIGGSKSKATLNIKPIFTEPYYNKVNKIERNDKHKP